MPSVFRDEDMVVVLNRQKLTFFPNLHLVTMLLMLSASHKLTEENYAISGTAIFVSIITL